MKFLKKVLAAVACVCVLAASVTLTSHAVAVEFLLQIRVRLWEIW